MPTSGLTGGTSATSIARIGLGSSNEMSYIIDHIKDPYLLFLSVLPGLVFCDI